MFIIYVSRETFSNFSKYCIYIFNSILNIEIPDNVSRETLPGIVNI